MRFDFHKMFFAMLFSGSVFGQQVSDTSVFLWIADEPVKVWEFETLRPKLGGHTFDEKVSRFIDFKMKALYARELKKDTLGYFDYHTEAYKSALARPYLTDTSTLEKLLRDAYDQSRYDLRADHILIAASPFDTPEDTLKAYRKISEAYGALSSGKPFEEVAQKYAQDTVEVGQTYFTSLQFMYPFEKVAYQTKPRTYSKPFRSALGYHIVYVRDKRKAVGEYQMAHIYIHRGDAAAHEMQRVYNQLEQGVPFDTLVTRYSQDARTNKRGGVLPPFTVGQISSSFEDQVLNLKVGDCSKPFETAYGWHIIKLLRRKVPGLQPYKDFEKIIRRKLLESSDRLDVVNQALYHRLLKVLRVERNAQTISDMGAYLNTPEALDDVRDAYGRLEILRVGSVSYSVSDFIHFWDKEVRKHLEQGKKVWLAYLIDRYCREKVLQYNKDYLLDTYTEVRRKLHIFQEELLVTDVSYQVVWNPLGASSASSLTDTEKREFDLEAHWLGDLRAKYKVRINPEVKSFLRLKNR